MFAQALYLATSDTVYLQTVVSSMLKEQRKLQQVMEDLFVPELEWKGEIKRTCPVLWIIIQSEYQKSVLYMAAWNIMVARERERPTHATCVVPRGAVLESLTRATQMTVSHLALEISVLTLVYL